MASKPWDPVELATLVVQGFTSDEIAKHLGVVASTIRRRKQTREYMRALRDIQREMYADELAAAADDIRLALKQSRRICATSQDAHAVNNAITFLNGDAMKRMALVDDKAGDDETEDRGPSLVERMKSALRPKPLDRSEVKRDG